MKLLFIFPAIGKKPGKRYIGTWKMEPLTVALLKALTPGQVETAYCDDRLELIDYDAPVDLVAITVETYTALRSYHIADRFRARGVRVVMGGYHVTALPNETLEHADGVIVGNAESVWLTMLADFQRNALQKIYYGDYGFSEVQPDKSIYAGKRYLPLSLVETGRGCCNTCEFCAIAGYYDRRYIPRPIDQVVAEVGISPHKYHFLVDDNLVADRKHALALFEALTPLRIKWVGQGTLSMARDPQLLEAMKKSGCELILVGFESLDGGNLAQMRKAVNPADARERDELVKRIHDAGIGIYATFVLGYDNDTEAAVAATVEFAKRHKFYTAAFNHVLPFPGTPLYTRLEQQGRLTHPRWWLEPEYRYGQLAFEPANISAQRLSMLCHDARKEFASPMTVLRRGIASMGRSSPLMWMLFWQMNLRLGEEIDEKMNVPLGGHLDELPK